MKNIKVINILLMKMKEQLPNKLVDSTTIRKDHTWFTHLFCIFLRILIGSFLILGSNLEQKKIFIIIFMMIIILGFSSKFMNNSNTWKVYLRTAIAYSTALLFTYNDHYNEAGLIVIVDALMGIQSRHTGVLFEIMKS